MQFFPRPQQEGDDLAGKTLRVRFEVNVKRGDTRSFVIEAHRDWAPRGFDRFAALVEEDFFGSGKCRFFRNIKGFMAQFGIHGKPEVAAKWKNRKIRDDEPTQSNTPGMVSFATSGKDSRTTQMFINHGDNSRLDGMGFAPFGKVVEGQDVVHALYSGYGEGGSGDGRDGRGPSQGRLQAEGNRYLKRVFPRLSYIVSTEVVTGEAGKDEL